MARTLRLAVLVMAVLAIGAPQASAFRKVHHGDPYRAFPKGKARVTAHASALGTFATTWPCTPKTLDLGQSHLSNAPEVKVIYAHPTDVTDQLTTGFAYANLMQADADAVRNKIAASGRSVRLDVGGTGNTCTGTENQHLDIQTV